MPFIDIYKTVYSKTHKRTLKSGETCVDVPEHECAPWMGKYALLSEEQPQEVESDGDSGGTAKTSSTARGKGRGRSARVKDDG